MGWQGQRKGMEEMTTTWAQDAYASQAPGIFLPFFFLCSQLFRIPTDDATTTLHVYTNHHHQR